MMKEHHSTVQNRKEHNRPLQYSIEQNRQEQQNKTKPKYYIA
jgi:hypothetical protein